ncbi:MAG: hypothetical protein D6757_04275 [Alphaproteobacteria bacterium]|nr:MAG: hypothetical protein D6757_04275 [Alphaproteobacteria bacterium]
MIERADGGDEAALAAILAPAVATRCRAVRVWPQRAVRAESSCRSAAEAAALVGVPVERIGKSLVFLAEREERAERAFVVVAHGGARVPLEPLETLMKASVRPARAKEVRKITGYEVGAVPPFGHARLLPVYIDRVLLAHRLFWVSAGDARTMMEMTPRSLQLLTAGRPIVLHEKENPTGRESAAGSGKKDGK